MWKIISFLFVPRWPFFFSSRTHHLPLLPSLVKPIDWRHHQLPLTPLFDRQSPPLSLSFPSFSLFPFLSTSPREKKVVAMVENQGRREEGMAGCRWQRQPTTLAVIDDYDGQSTSVERDVEEGREGGRRGRGWAHLWVEGSLPTLVLPSLSSSIIMRVAGCRRQWQLVVSSSLLVMSKGKERKREGKGREEEIADQREVWVATGDDVS